MHAMFSVQLPDAYKETWSICCIVRLNIVCLYNICLHIVCLYIGMLERLQLARAYLALNLDVIRDEFDVSCYDVVPAAKQVLGEGTGVVSNGPAGRKSFSIYLNDC